MSAWVVTMGAGATMGSCIRRLSFHPKEWLGPKSITWASEMAKHNSGDLYTSDHHTAECQLGWPDARGSLPPSSHQRARTSWRSIRPPIPSVLYGKELMAPRSGKWSWV